MNKLSKQIKIIFLSFKRSLGSLFSCKVAFLYEKITLIWAYSVRHLVFFVRLVQFTEPLIYLARVFAFLQILVHTRLLLLLTPDAATPLHRLTKEQPHLAPSVSWLLGLSCIAPVTSIVLGKSWYQTGWWSVTFLVTLSVRSMLQWREDEEKNIAELEKLKYSAGGA